jgi:uncharacterized protein YciI
MKSVFAALSIVLVAVGVLVAADPTPGMKPSQYLGILRLAERYHSEANWDDAAKSAVGRHFTRLKELSKTGKVILAGRTREANEKTMGLVIFEAKDMGEAERFMAEDPAVQAGVMLAEVRPYQVAIMRE